MNELNVFFSYTLRGSDLNIDMISELKNKLSRINHLNAYFDILDNTSLNRQEYVYKRLDEANVFCLIKSSHIDKSKWVSKEIEMAKNRGIPIVYLDIKDIENIVASISESELLAQKKICEILKCMN